ncbi:MAG: DEAD/DEAH box helicase [Pirellulales bacterium]|nr:DEAD/DEAH box helicase [Pirellulales bacterium]
MGNSPTPFRTDGESDFHPTSPLPASGVGQAETSGLPTHVGTNSFDLSVAAPALETLLPDGPRQHPVVVRHAKLKVAPPQTVSLAFPTPLVRTQGFVFSENAANTILSSPSQSNASAELARGDQPRTSERRIRKTRSHGRIVPPNEMLKLEDRLLCLLEPPVDTWMQRSALTFTQKPFAHQWDGVAFLFPRQQAILADEMGLGKTMQAITTIRLLLHAGRLSTILLICPKPLVTNWQQEFSRWAPEIPVAVVEGAANRRAWRWNASMPVKIANYELLHRDAALLGESSSAYDLVVIDEAQRIKNRTSTISQLVRNIPRRRSWALTGTPVENSPNDLVGIFEFLSPGYLDEGMQLSRLSSLAADHVLRRTKSDVQIDLPPKLFRDVALPLSPQQAETYRIAEEDGALRLTELGHEVTIQHVFELVLRLKQICNFDPATETSSKLERLEADLEEIAESGQKAIVFSQWVETLQRLSRNLQRFGPLEYHGRIPSRHRDAILNRFRNDPNAHVLLMSYGAGGVGLNLQFTQYVFLFDRWWNPAVEDQAINRAHRIGAESPVTIVRFLASGTIEERIDEVLQQKRDLFDAILSHTRPPDELGLSREEIFGLVGLEQRTARNAA